MAGRPQTETFINDSVRLDISFGAVLVAKFTELPHNITGSDSGEQDKPEAGNQ